VRRRRVPDMDMRAGGAALSTTPDTSEAETGSKLHHLRAELEAARRRAIMTNARSAVLLRDPDASLSELAASADESALAAGRIAGLARLLQRALPIAILSLV
jgi:hypothetical protein